MAVNEQIVTGRKFRKLIDETQKIWQRISFWTKASDVEFDDGQTLENKTNSMINDISILTSKLGNLSFVVLTKEEYDSIPEPYPKNTVYLIIENQDEE